MSKEAENLMKAMKELQTLRARVECECQPRPEHQPGSPPMDLDELDREGHEWDHGQLLRAARSLGAELRTLRARVAELEDKAAGYLHAFKDGCVRSEERITELECQRDLAQDEARALNEKRAELRATIRDLESQLAVAREVASPNKPR